MPDSLNRFSTIHTFLLFFSKKLRLSNPWNFKVPFLICIPYFIFLLSGSSHGALPSVLASLCVIIGIAGFGYLTNDLGDRHKDSLIQKANATAGLSLAGIVFLFVLFVSLAVLPWLYLPMNRTGMGLLALQFLLFYVYAFPPFRLKERGFLGVLADAGYAHVNPALLAAYTFYLFTGRTFTSFYAFLGLLLAWQFVLGIRNILMHQLKDHDSDLASGTRTFVTKTGVEKTSALIKTILLPVETLLFIAFACFITLYLYFFLPVMALYWLYITWQIRRHNMNVGFREYTYLYMDDLCTKWIPLITLTGLVMRSVYFLPVLVLHVLIFRNEVKDFFITRSKRLR